MEHERGWSSFPSAVAAGIYLFLRGSVRVVRYQIDQFELTRRALAYLFRRGLDRLANEDQNTPLMPLQPDLFKDLGPDVSSIETLQKPFESDLKDFFLVDSKGQKTAGVFALVAERGAGKTTIIRHIASQNQNSITVDCPELGLGCLTRSLATQLHLLPDASIEECAQRAERDGTPKIILIDNAHRLIKPVMGGLADFDRLIAAARRNSRTCAWVLTLDDVIWRFFESGRGIRPLFDSVTKLSSWNENSIAELLQKRSQQVNLEPSFERLIEKLPADADEIDFAQAREKAATGYYRFLWDYSDGNPGVALQMWRQSLAVDHSGKVFVRYYSAPDTKELEKLPDSGVFVLRAVLQMGYATASDVAQATMLSCAQVEDNLEYGLARGYFLRDNNFYHITWTWFRAISRYLRRRHLLPRTR